MTHKTTHDMFGQGAQSRGRGQISIAVLYQLKPIQPVTEKSVHGLYEETDRPKGFQCVLKKSVVKKIVCLIQIVHTYRKSEEKYQCKVREVQFNCAGNVCFYVLVCLDLDPFSSLRTPNVQRYLFLDGKGVFLCFCCWVLECVLWTLPNSPS